MSEHDQMQDPAGVQKPLSKSAVEGTVITEETGGVTAEEDLKQRAELVENMQDARDFIQATAITRDFFASYNLGERVNRRISMIGSKEGSENSLGQEETDVRGFLTLQAELARLMETVKAALSHASEIIKDLPDVKKGAD